jgi:crotonobetainyl-CoA:carnitine CoA-transferase CaiB-like acyl-CoA transferase
MAGPLAGIRVIDLSSMVSGPLATAILGDQGAEVIKIEPPGEGDRIRHIGCARGGLSAIFTTLNRNKRSVVLNLSDDRGRALLLRLVSRADVFVQNFRPGVAERMGLGEAALRRVAPDLVYVSISGFGESGPYAERRVYDIVIQALSGMAALQADPATGSPELVRNIVCDKVTAVHAAQAICAALLARERGAGGQHVRLAMLDASIAFLWPDGMQAYTYLGPGATAPAPLHGILRAFPTADGFATLLAISDAEFAGLARALGRPELLSDARFAGVPARMQHSDALAGILREATRNLPTADLCARLEAEGVPCAPIHSPEEVHADPQVVANELLVETDHPHCGRVRTPRSPARFDATPCDVQGHAPLLGEHTDAVLTELGVTAHELTELRSAAAVA